MGVTRLDEGPGSGGHVAQFLPHAPAVVDHQSDCDRGVFVPEETDGLGAAIFKNFEVLTREVGDGVTFAVANGGLQYHQRDIY